MNLMKAFLARKKRGAALSMFFLLLAGQTAPAQTPPLLNVQIYAGVNIAGSTSALYAIQSTANPAQSNSWSSIALVQSFTSNYLWLDTTTPAVGRRFYRAVSIMASNM